MRSPSACHLALILLNKADSALLAGDLSRNQQGHPMSDSITRYFTSYSGAKLPLKLVGELSAADMRNRNTYYRGEFDAAGRLLTCEKVVYGETEQRHDYRYHPEGSLAQASIDDGSGEPQIIEYPL